MSCKKNCCWTPYSCARQHQCACHSDDQPIGQRITRLELERATALAAMKGTRR